MSYRYQELLAWIIPGFFLIITIPFAMGYIDGLWSTLNNNTLKQLIASASAQYWNAVTAFLIFLIPITSLITGWVINAFGGWIMKLPYLKKFIISGTYTSQKDKDFDIIEEYDHIIRTTDFDTLDHLDRFYYRYVFSRNMMTAQIFLLITSFFNLLVGKSSECPCRIIMLEIFMAFIFFMIMRRDLRTHASFVFNHSKSFQQ